MLCKMIRPTFDSSATPGGEPNIIFFDESPAIVAENVAAAHAAVQAGEQPPEPLEIGSVAISSPERYALERTLWVVDFGNVTKADQALRLATAPGRYALEWLIRQDLHPERSDFGPAELEIQTLAGYRRAGQTEKLPHGTQQRNGQYLSIGYTLVHRVAGPGQPPSPVLRYDADGIPGITETGPVIVHHALVTPANPGA